MNTSAPLFAENNFEEETERNLAELYCRIYALAAEDFTTTADVDNFIKELTEWMRLLQKQQTTLMRVISTHTHIIPPHTHPMEPHTHVCAAPGQPSSPNVGAFTTMPMQLTTNIPVESQQIVWNDVPSPSYKNTTMVTPNKTGNRVITGPTMVGPLTMNQRRAKTPKALLKPGAVPLIKEMAKI